MKKLFFNIILISIINFSFGQSILSRNYKRYSVEVFTGLNSFHGDIKGKTGFVLGTKFNWQLIPAFALHTSLDYSRLNGFDKNRNDKFSNNTFKMLLGGEVYLFNIAQIKNISSKFQPFIGLGFGGLKSNFSNSSVDGFNINSLNNDWLFCYQFSGGMKVRLTKSLALNAKLAFFYTKSDLLDNYKSLFTNNKNNDAFNEYTVGISYHFGKKEKEALIWKTSNNNFFSYKPTNKKKKFKMIETGSDFNINNTKITSDKPIPTNIEEPTYQDVDKNEFDCIIKY